MDLTKSYAENKNKKPFDWNKFLNKKGFTEEEALYAEEMANDWVTCACGNQCAIIPRHPHWGAPIDKELRRLGTRFANEISYMDYEEARKILEAIEIRSAQLIKEITDANG